MKLNKYSILLFFLFVFIQYSCNKDNSEELFAQNATESLTNLNMIKYGSNNENGTNTLKNDKAYERFKIVHISDIHLSDFTADNHYDNPINLKQAIEFANLQECQINALVASGDFINTTEKDNKQTAIKYLNA